ncbi:hypothetical protein HaLaN_03603 [Haematococcus lacustris]|uniref:Uncharacterized protein n=1 Tax=Haematococcus lacustris TaxID=44745 RepID=A0A699YNY5_HAELA|nr:hypothetical protein HaLaN_03603 [Haematococcus lacustris]
MVCKLEVSWLLREAMRDQVQCIHALMKAVPPALRVNSAGTSKNMGGSHRASAA